MKAWHLGVLSLAFLACAGPQTVQTTSATLPAPNAQGEYAPDWPQFGNGQARYITIQLGPDSSARCHEVSPKFALDSTVTYVQDRAQLAAFARCMNHESMASQKVLLVGRTDPRGSEAYNLELGSKRAQQIKALLVDAGLSADRIELATEGKRDAKGNLPDYSYGYDRRVDVVVTGVTHKP